MYTSAIIHIVRTIVAPWTCCSEAHQPTEHRQKLLYTPLYPAWVVAISRAQIILTVLPSNGLSKIITAYTHTLSSCTHTYICEWVCGCNSDCMNCLVAGAKSSSSRMISSVCGMNSLTLPSVTVVIAVAASKKQYYAVAMA